MTLRVVVALGALAVLVACTSGRTTNSPTSDLTIFAAASLGNVLDEVRGAYESSHPGTALTIATDSSAALAAQIEQGAPADVFLSADVANPARLVDGGFADGEPVVFARNELAIITPTDNPGGLTGALDLARAGVRVIAAGDEVPITRYASELVNNLASEPGAAPEFAAAYAANIVSEEDNVAAVRAKIELGEGDAAIVYATDAAASELIATIEPPRSVNVRAEYAAVVVASASNPEEGHVFLEWLTSHEGQDVLARLGFLPPRP